MENKYGYCNHCGGRLLPVWFTEEEYKTEGGRKWKTGRKRTAVSHLVCEDCLKNEACDDSFDKEWK